MLCPYCGARRQSLKVVDSRACEGGRAIRRRRICAACKKRFTTYERAERNLRLTVVKKDGSRVPFERNKVLTGLERACYKRPVSEADLQKLVDEVEDELHRRYDREVPSTIIGQLVMQRLRKLDEVAYVRFASVYRQFKTLDELMREARAVMEIRRHDVPGQRILFSDEPGDKPDREH